MIAKSIILAGTLCLSSCMTMEEFAQANATPTPNLEPLIMYVSDTHSTCLAMGARVTQSSYHIDGCADPYGKFVPGRCLVILPKILGIEVNKDKEHEIAHCKWGNWHSMKKQKADIKS